MKTAMSMRQPSSPILRTAPPRPPPRSAVRRCRRWDLDLRVGCQRHEQRSDGHGRPALCRKRGDDLDQFVAKRRRQRQYAADSSHRRQLVHDLGCDRPRANGIPSWQRPADNTGHLGLHASVSRVAQYLERELQRISVHYLGHGGAIRGSAARTRFTLRILDPAVPGHRSTSTLTPAPPIPGPK